VLLSAAPAEEYQHIAAPQRAAAGVLNPEVEQHGACKAADMAGSAGVAGDGICMQQMLLVMTVAYHAYRLGGMSHAAMHTGSVQQPIIAEQQTRVALAVVTGFFVWLVLLAVTAMYV
jgi:hypothetical protein